MRPIPERAPSARRRRRDQPASQLARRSAGYHSVERRPDDGRVAGTVTRPERDHPPRQHPQATTAGDRARAHRYGAHCAEAMAPTSRCAAPPPPPQPPAQE